MMVPLTLAVAIAQTTGTEITIYSQGISQSNPNYGYGYDYNYSNQPFGQGFGFIKEQRSVNLKKGVQEIEVRDVAAFIETNSVTVRDLRDTNNFSILEQNYQYDLINQQAILNRSVGKKIRFNRVLPNGQKEILTGTLISSPTAVVNDGNNNSFTWNGLVIQTDDGRIILNPTGEIEVQSIPEGLISTPTLKWLIDSASAGNHLIELSYLTQGMSWNSDYVVNLDEKTKKANIKGWVTLNNQCGKSFKNAKLKLLAGDVNRIVNRLPRSAAGFGGGAAPEMKANQFAEESLFEYHLYTLSRPTDVLNKQTKQVSLLEATEVPYTKRIVVDSMLNFGMYRPSESEIGTGDIKPIVRVEFYNKKENGMGIPLPAGRVKAYQRDSSGSSQMIGEDKIDHTPKDEKISLNVGRSFDIRATRKRTSFKSIGNNTYEETFEIEVRNRKDVPETVTVLERRYWEWTVTEKNMDFNKVDSQTMEFLVDLKANETKTIKYTVITKL